MILVCVFCGGRCDDPHHITGRGPDDRYLDPELVAPTCHSDHELCGDDEHTRASADDSEERNTFLDMLELRLARTGGFLGRLAETLPEPLATLIGLIARHLAGWSTRLGDSIAALDRYSPGWRAAPGV